MTRDPRTRRVSHPRHAAVRRLATGIAIAGIALTAIVAVNDFRWIGRSFPSFLIMQNRVVASAALRGWLAIDASGLFQHEVVAVDGLPVASSTAIYDYVAQRPAETGIEYTLRAPHGGTSTLHVPSRRFSGFDFARLFLAYLLTGLSFGATGLLVWVLKPGGVAAHGLLSCGLIVGVFAVTGADLYGPHWFFRLHVVAESLLPAALVHLGLVFPVDRLGVRQRRRLAAVYGPFVLLAIIYQTVLMSPAAYTTIHLVAVAAQGMAAVAMFGSAGLGFVTSHSPLVRRRIGVVALGAVAGILVPGAISGASALLGGGVPVNFAAFTVFLFPLSLGYAILKHDLFEIDVVLRQAISYFVVALAVGTAYTITILCTGRLIPSRDLISSAPVVLGLVNVALVFLIAPLRTRTQLAIDRVFSRSTYDPQEATTALGSALTMVSTVEAVAGATHRTLTETLAPIGATIYVMEADAMLHLQGAPTDGPAVIVLPPELAERAHAGESLVRYEWDDGGHGELPPLWNELDAELLVPIRDGRGLVGLIALGRRASGVTYRSEDLAFLKTVASQTALGIEDARLAKQLEHKQASLIRADRLATLGRLASGVAHEMGSPIGAILNSLRVVVELGREYQSSIDEPTVLPADHRQIAAEIIKTAEQATEWTEKAATFLKRMTKQAREPGSETSRRFTITSVIADVDALLAHRLRSSSVHLDYEPTESTLVAGDPGALGQILANLVGNAIDAYEDAAPGERRIRMEVRNEADVILLTIRDWAGGMPAEIFARIFDELYTTKEVGRGTGLGLWISRNLIEQRFGGTLEAETVQGVGTCFVATFPVPQGDAGSAPVASHDPASDTAADDAGMATGPARAA